jgi:hypothetical protein
MSDGLSWSEVNRFQLKIGVDDLSERMFYCIQNPFAPSLFELGEADCDHSFEPVTQGEVLSFDGSWNHPRKTFTLISILTNRLLKK